METKQLRLHLDNQGSDIWVDCDFNLWQIACRDDQVTHASLSTKQFSSQKASIALLWREDVNDSYLISGYSS
jgi:hypothetical protein